MALEADPVEPTQIDPTPAIGDNVVAEFTVILNGLEVAEQPFDPVTVTVGFDAVLTRIV